MVKEHMAFQPQSCQGHQAAAQVTGGFCPPNSLQLPNSRAHPCLRARSVQEEKRLLIEPEGLFPLMFPFKRQLFLKMGLTVSLLRPLFNLSRRQWLEYPVQGYSFQRPWRGWGHAELCWAKKLPSPSGGGLCTLQL